MAAVLRAGRGGSGLLGGVFEANLGHTADNISGASPVMEAQTWSVS